MCYSRWWNVPARVRRGVGLTLRWRFESSGGTMPVGMAVANPAAGYPNRGARPAAKSAQRGEGECVPRDVTPLYREDVGQS